MVTCHNCFSFDLLVRQVLNLLNDSLICKLLLCRLLVCIQIYFRELVGISCVLAIVWSLWLQFGRFDYIDFYTKTDVRLYGVASTIIPKMSYDQLASFT